jgi:hypothetical protein
LSRDLAERAAKFIVTQLEACECELMWPLPELGCDIARQLASAAGIGPEIEEMLAKSGRC